jgi:hypothetical protein
MTTLEFGSQEVVPDLADTAEHEVTGGFWAVLGHLLLKVRTKSIFKRMELGGGTGL